MPYNTGPIPSSFGYLTSLRTLALSDNSLTGSVPNGVYGSSTLTSLMLGENQYVYKALDKRFFLGATIEWTVTILIDHLFRLSGTIPDIIKNATSLETIVLDLNTLSGSHLPEASEDLDISPSQKSSSINLRFFVRYHPSSSLPTALA